MSINRGTRTTNKRPRNNKIQTNSSYENEIQVKALTEFLSLAASETTNTDQKPDIFTNFRKNTIISNFGIEKYLGSYIIELELYIFFRKPRSYLG